MSKLRTLWFKTAISAMAGVVLLGGSLAPSAAAPISPPSGANGSIVQQAEMNGSREIIRRYSNRPSFRGNDNRSDRNRFDRNRFDNRRDASRNFDRRRYENRRYDSARQYSYDRDRYGPRYRDRRYGYNHYRGGYWYATPWWLGAGAAAAIIGSAIASPAPVYGDGHVAWCDQRYRSYDPRSDSFLGNDGRRHRCISP